MIARLAAVGLAWLALTAATPLPLSPPPPDLGALVPWAAAPLDKPAIELPRLAVPPPPLDDPVVPPSIVFLPEAPKPMATLPFPRALPCVGAWLRIPSESLECGRARLRNGELEEAARALESAARPGADRDVLSEGRYWLAEVLYRLGRIEQADWSFRQVLVDLAVPEYGPWALHGSGWTALRLGDPARAEDAFRRLLGAIHPVPLDAWGRLGLALALYLRGQYVEAEKVLAELSARRMPLELSRDVLFWHGETLARTGKLDRGIERLTAFVQGGAHALQPSGLLRLGWWRLAAGKAPEALTAFRALAATPPSDAREREWLDAGVALALLATGDVAGARAALQPLDGRRSALAQPVRLRLLAGAVASGQAAEAQALAQELLGANLPPPVRGWVLLVKGEALRAEGNRDEARTQFDLARSAGATGETAQHATLRLALMNFELREFAQAVADLAPLLAAQTPRDMRVAVLLLRGESAYHAGDYRAAADAYRRLLADFPDHPQASAVRLALAWTALRHGTREDALKQFQAFAQATPADPHAVDALVLASELMLALGQTDAARELLDRISTTHGAHPRAEFARLNRALLALRTGDAQQAQRELAGWLARAPSPPLIGRAAFAHGVALLALDRPADAAREFGRAQAEGLADLARLGLGTVALLEQRWDDAARELAQARDSGTPPVVAAAEYGLAVVGFHKGNQAAFRPTAQAALDAAPRGPGAPRLLYVLTGLAVADRDWPASLATARRLVAEFPADAAADDGLERVGSAAAAARAWPVAYEAYALLRQRYPQSPFVHQSAMLYAQALIETGRPEEARRVLEIVAGTPGDPRAGQAWLMLARAREAAGDRAGALEAYNRAAQSGDGVPWTSDAMLSHGRALLAAGRWSESRTVLQRVLRGADGANAAEAALAMGEAWAGQGDHLAAAEYFMTASYVAPDSPAGRRALLAAGKSLAAARNADAAAIVYRKLLAQSDLPADVAAEARKGLAELKR